MIMLGLQASSAKISIQQSNLHLSFEALLAWHKAVLTAFSHAGVLSCGIHCWILMGDVSVSR